ncbi:hypothetical protein DUT90_08630 [Polaribacter sp. WD7]|uniref:2TM domain-containing protein n=1 Tax=Polaribacter sp. WD7 TaxID=2269061 RepID=UPI000DF27240|nr:2TM domain-containing protein [Polaribacter sp. WD7]RCS27160.1 hypothetical protein DUT90_08630 [Polaribacter sp. WD7]
MQQDFRQEQQYLKAKKRVKDIKGFYIHLTVYVIINVFISCVIIYGLTVSGDTFTEALSNFGVFSTWIFWGIGIFFHWLGVFGFRFLGFGKEWEERKIKEMMEKQD